MNSLPSTTPNVPEWIINEAANCMLIWDLLNDSRSFTCDHVWFRSPNFTGERCGNCRLVIEDRDFRRLNDLQQQAVKWLCSWRFYPKGLGKLSIIR